MNPEQLQSLAVLALAMVPVAVLWWVWIRMLDLFGGSLWMPASTSFIDLRTQKGLIDDLRLHSLNQRIYLESCAESIHLLPAS